MYYLWLYMHLVFPATLCGKFTIILILRMRNWKFVWLSKCPRSQLLSSSIFQTQVVWLQSCCTYFSKIIYLKNMQYFINSFCFWDHTLYHVPNNIEYVIESIHYIIFRTTLHLGSHLMVFENNVMSISKRKKYVIYNSS